MDVFRKQARALTVLLSLTFALAMPARGEANAPSTAKAKTHRTARRAKKKYRSRSSRRVFIARRASPAPLLPPRELSDEYSQADEPESVPESAPEKKNPPPQAEADTRPAPDSANTEPWRLGIEGGVMGWGTATTSPDVLGLQIFTGGRVTSFIPVWDDRLMLRPGFGYFMRSETSTYGSAWENRVEINGNIQYALLRWSGFHFLVGAEQTVPITFTRTKTGSLTTWSSLNPAYQVGPSATILWDLGAGISLIVDSEVTFEFESPVEPAYGLLGGFSFGF